MRGQEFMIRSHDQETRVADVADARLRGRHNNTMSIGEVRRLVERHGLKIVDWHGIMCLDKSFYNFMPRRLWALFERTLRAMSFPKRWHVYLVFVCRKA